MKIVKRWLTIIAGVCVVIIGLILMPVPGPGGTPVTLAGLAILACELPAVRGLRDRLLALRARYYSSASPRKRFALITGILALYAVTTAGLWWFWNSGKS